MSKLYSLQGPGAAPIKLARLVDGAIYDQILKPGEYRKDGQDIVFDERTMRQMVDNFAGRMNDLPGDFEHSAVNAPQHGQMAPLACSYDTLELVLGGRIIHRASHAAALPPQDVKDWGDGIWGRRVRMTECGIDAVEKKGYSDGYISPTFSMDAVDEQGQPIGADLFTASWTVIPFLDGMEPLRLHRVDQQRTIKMAVQIASGNAANVGDGAHVVIDQHTVASGKIEYVKGQWVGIRERSGRLYEWPASKVYPYEVEMARMAQGAGKMNEFAKMAESLKCSDPETYAKMVGMAGGEEKMPALMAAMMGQDGDENKMPGMAKAMAKMAEAIGAEKMAKMADGMGGIDGVIQMLMQALGMLQDMDADADPQASTPGDMPAAMMAEAEKERMEMARLVGLPGTATFTQIRAKTAATLGADRVAFAKLEDRLKVLEGDHAEREAEAAKQHQATVSGLVKMAKDLLFDEAGVEGIRVLADGGHYKEAQSQLERARSAAAMLGQRVPVNGTRDMSIAKQADAAIKKIQTRDKCDYATAMSRLDKEHPALAAQLAQRHRARA
jgi:hypothetical protein